MTKPANPFRYFNSSPEVIRLAVMMYVKFPLSNVEDLLAERRIDVTGLSDGVTGRLEPRPLEAGGRPSE